MSSDQIKEQFKPLSAQENTAALLKMAPEQKKQHEKVLATREQAAILCQSISRTHFEMTCYKLAQKVCFAHLRNFCSLLEANIQLSPTVVFCQGKDTGCGEGYLGS